MKEPHVTKIERAEDGTLTIHTSDGKAYIGGWVSEWKTFDPHSDGSGIERTVVRSVVQYGEVTFPDL